MSLIAHYRMNDGSTVSSLLDSAGNYNFTITGSDHALRSDGVIQKSMYFGGGDNGGTSYASRANIIPITNFSLALWIKTTSSTTGQAIWLGSSPHTYFGIRQEDGDIDDSLFFEWAYSPYSGAEYRSINFTDGSEVGNWVHLVVTYDGDAIRTYADTVLQNTDSGETINPSAAATMYMNQGSDGEGYLDDVRIYNHVLSQAEISVIYCHGVGTEAQDAYPFVPVPSFPISESVSYDIIVSTISGKERRRARHNTPRRAWVLDYHAINDGDCVYLWDFYRSMRGNHKSFSFLHPETSVAYEARFADKTLKRTETGENVYDMEISLIEAIK